MAERIVAEVFPPSDFIRDEMQARGWDLQMLSDASLLKPQLLTEVLSGHRRITPIIALGLSSAFGTGRQIWINLQSTFERRNSNEGESSEA